MQIRQRIFNHSDMQIMHFILDKILKHLTYYTPFYHQSLQNYLSQKQSVFLSRPVQNGNGRTITILYSIHNKNTYILSTSDGLNCLA